MNIVAFSSILQNFNTDRSRPAPTTSDKLTDKSRPVSAIFKKISFFIALIAGIILTFSFAPFNVYTLAVIAPAVLLWLWLKASPKQAFFQGLLFGIGFFASGIHWVYISLHIYGAANPLLAALITGLFILYLALFPALQGFILNKFFANNLKKILLVFPTSWTLLEWVRSWFLTGFPWLGLGYSQIDAPLRGLAAIGGIYLVTFATAFSAASLVGMWYSKNQKNKLIIIAALILLWVGGAQLAKIKWTTPIGNKIKVSLIQGNVPQQVKWQPHKLNHILKKYRKLTEKHWHSKIIIWPEAAIPTLQTQVQNYLDNLEKQANQHNTTIISGIPIVAKEDVGQKYYNGILAFGEYHGMYLKKHLVPFGEFVPLKFLLNDFRKWIDIPMSDFDQGPAHQPLLQIAKIPIAAFICYEIAYPNLVLDYMPKAQLLLTISDDSWFGKSIALAQHLQIARMRSLETGRYQLINSNTGFTAIIDNFGKIIAYAPLFKTYVLTADVQPMQGKTPWISYGKYWWIWLTLLICLSFIRTKNKT